MKNICVFIGSANGSHSKYAASAKALGKAIAEHQMSLVYGGASVGLMGLLADSVLEAGGEAIGVMPKCLVDKEIAHKNLSQLFVVETMQERKKMLMELGEAFVVFPGGFGTLEEMFEITNAAKIGLHKKRIGLLNIDNYFADLLSFIKHTIREGFLNEQQFSLLKQFGDPVSLIKSFKGM